MEFSMFVDIKDEVVDKLVGKVVYPTDYFTRLLNHVNLLVNNVDIY